MAPDLASMSTSPGEPRLAASVRSTDLRVRSARAVGEDDASPGSSTTSATSTPCPRAVRIPVTSPSCAAATATAVAATAVATSSATTSATSFDVSAFERSSVMPWSCSARRRDRRSSSYRPLRSSACPHWATIAWSHSRSLCVSVRGLRNDRCSAPRAPRVVTSGTVTHPCARGSLIPVNADSSSAVSAHTGSPVPMAFANGTSESRSRPRHSSSSSSS